MRPRKVFKPCHSIKRQIHWLDKKGSLIIPYGNMTIIKNSIRHKVTTHIRCIFGWILMEIHFLIWNNRDLRTRKSTTLGIWLGMMLRWVRTRLVRTRAMVIWLQKAPGWDVLGWGWEATPTDANSSGPCPWVILIAISSPILFDAWMYFSASLFVFWRNKACKIIIKLLVLLTVNPKWIRSNFKPLGSLVFSFYITD